MRFVTRSAAAFALLIALAFVAGCSGSSDGAVDAQPADPADTAGSSQPAPAGGSDPALADPSDPWGIPELVVTPIGDEQQDWGLRAQDGWLVGYHVVAPGTWRFVRFDPETGRVAASVELPEPEGWATSPDAIVFLGTDRRTVTIRDIDSLEVRHVVDLGPDARAGMNADTPRSDQFWLGLRRQDTDQLAGIETRMQAIRLDLQAGTVVETQEAPPCGAGSVVQTDEDQIVIGVVCSYQVATVDLDSGRTETFEGLPVGAQLLALDGTAWMRWKQFGVLGRLRAGDKEIETLDLNADAPTLSDLQGFIGGPRGLWITATPADPDSPRLLHLLDPKSFTVVGRAWTQTNVAFVGDMGFTIQDGRLATFDPDQVKGGKPDKVVRPEPGPPEQVEPKSKVEQQVVEAFTTVFDPRVANEAAAANLADAAELSAVRTRLLELVAKVYPGVELVVTSVAVDGDSASVAYVYLLDGKVAFVPLSGALERVDGTWKVTRQSVCGLATAAAVAEC